MFFPECQKIRRNTITLITLHSISADKLFIKDDFGEDHLGCYYYCVHMDTYVKQGVNKLLSHIINSKSYRKVFFVGTSKGGWASLYYGLDYPNASIIIGAPQYYLGDYLLIRKSSSLLHTIAGIDYSDSNIDTLNHLVKDKLQHNQYSFRGTIYLHYSKREHTYKEHIIHLLNDLKSWHYAVIEDVHDYTEHDDVAFYYPTFLKKTIANLINTLD